MRGRGGSLGSRGASQFGVTTTNTHTRQTTTQAVMGLVTNGAIDGEGTAALIVDGVRVNITNAFGAGYFLTAVLFKETDCANCLSFTASDDLDEAFDVTTVGFQADTVFFVPGPQVTDDATGTTVELSFGIALDTCTQMAVSWVDRDNVVTLEVSAVTRTNRAGVSYTSAGISPWSYELSAFDASGFTQTLRDNDAVTGACPSGCGVYALALAWTTPVQQALAQVNSPSAPGPSSVTFVGFTPGFGLVVTNAIDAAVGTTDTADADGIGVSVLTLAAQVSNAVYGDDGIGTSNTGAVSANQAVLSVEGDGVMGTTTLHSCTFSTFTATGWDWSCATAHSTARRWIMYAIGR